MFRNRWKCKGRPTKSRTPPSLTSLMVSVDVKHHVYLLTYPNMKTVLSDWGKNLQRQRDEPLDGETKDYDR